MTVETYYIALKEMLKSKPKKLESQSDLLFVLANTMRAMVVNTDKSQLVYLDSLLVKRISQELKLAFDFCQGYRKQRIFRKSYSIWWLFCCGSFGTRSGNLRSECKR